MVPPKGSWSAVDRSCNGKLNGLREGIRSRAGLRLRRGRPMPEGEESDLLHVGNLLMCEAVCDCRCAGLWKAFTIRSNPLELSRRLRYILAVHTTCQGCPENVDFSAVFRGSRRGAENPSLSATLKWLRESPVKSGSSAHRELAGVAPGCSPQGYPYLAYLILTGNASSRSKWQ